MADGGRVLQLLAPSTGGIRRHVAFLTAALRERGWSVETAGPAGVLDGLVAQDHDVDIPGGLALRRLPAGRRALRRLLPAYDVVHAHGLTAGWLAALARGRRRAPALVVTVHNLTLAQDTGLDARARRFLEARLPARADAVLAVSGGVARRLAEGAGGTDIVVSAAVGPAPVPRRPVAEVRAALGADAGTTLIVSVGRLHAQKGFDVLLDAMARVIAHAPQAHLAVVGEGPLDAALREQAARLGIALAVVFAESDHAVDELAAADVVVIASRWESGPLVLAEAMLLGRPVVATGVGAVPELVTDGSTGWLVPIADAPALADALSAAIADPAEAARRGKAGAERARAALDPATQVSIVEGAYRASLDRA